MPPTTPPTTPAPPGLYPKTARFGISSLDALIGRHDFSRSPVLDEDGTAADNLGILLTPANAFTNFSLCIAGPSGVGKSILALHLAARYAADTYTFPDVCVFYASTDLSYSQAQRTHDDFNLGKPKTVYEPFNGHDDPVDKPTRWNAPGYPTSVTLKSLNLRSVAEHILNPHGAAGERRVGFVNIQSETAGDDWQFLNNLISLLPTPQSDQEPQHLLVVDAIEGLETLAGTRDAFGMERLRRSRITQLIRTASTKCHLVFVVEGGEAREHPEKFVTDFVLRLRNSHDTGDQQQYQRRTIEVEKARGQAHTNGQHILLIRSKDGATTGRQGHQDEPDRKHSYLYVVPSLHYVARRIMRHKGNRLPEANASHVADFGIRYLDDMLRKAEPSATTQPADDLEERGLPCGTVTALTGDDGTQKSRLTRAFAARHFVKYAKMAAEQIGVNADNAVTDTKVNAFVTQMETLIVKYENDNLTAEERSKRPVPLLLPTDAERKGRVVTVFLTTQDTDYENLIDQFVKHITWRGQRWAALGLTDTQKGRLDGALRHIMKTSVLCRHLEKHYLAAPTLFHILRQYIRKAQFMILGNARTYRATDARYNEGWRIRVVIEDWQVIRDTYPDVRHDDTFLGLMLFYLRRQGAATLISHTRPGQPEEVAEADENRLQNEADYNLRTWRIQFSGLDRVALAAIPPIAPDRPSLVRELTWESERPDEAVTVDPRLELYQGLRENRPRLTPLRIRLYAESPAFLRYAERIQRLLRERFPKANEADIHDIQVLCSDADAPGGSGESYENLRDLSHLQGDTPLDHTLVFMVDEFWAVADVDENPATPRTKSRLGSLSEYLNRPTWKPEWGADTAADPDNLFQPNLLAPDSSEYKIPKRRASYFELPDAPNRSEANKDADRVPFTKNFGFLLCRANAWSQAAREPLTAVYEAGYPPYAAEPIRVGDVWNALTGKTNTPELLSWRIFLEACSVAAKSWLVREGSARPFDLSRNSAESLCCLGLEIWASEICRNDSQKAKELFGQLTDRKWRQDPKNDKSLIDWLAADKNRWTYGEIACQTEILYCPSYTSALYRTLLLLSEVLTREVLDEVNNPFLSQSPHTPQTSPAQAAVASRVWYTTVASEEQQQAAAEDPLIPVALPGRFSTRGDWYLAISPGSSAPRLAERAIDLLSSRTGNITRLEKGIGLPVRKPSSRYDALETQLSVLSTDGRRLEPMLYEDVIKMAPAVPTDTIPHPRLRPLWRSRLCDYDRHARIWQKWLLSELSFFIKLRHQKDYSWTNSFEVYDMFPQDEIYAPAEIQEWETWVRFGKRCDDLVRDLKGASLYRD